MERQLEIKEMVPVLEAAEIDPTGGTDDGIRLPVQGRKTADGRIQVPEETEAVFRPIQAATVIEKVFLRVDILHTRHHERGHVRLRIAVRDRYPDPGNGGKQRTDQRLMGRFVAAVADGLVDKEDLHACCVWVSDTGFRTEAATWKCGSMQPMPMTSTGTS